MIININILKKLKKTIDVATILCGLGMFCSIQKLLVGHYTIIRIKFELFLTILITVNSQ